MTKLSLVLAAATAVFGTASAWGFKKPCIPDVDICGWALQSDYGYDNEILADATYEANQDPGSGTVIYDSIYNCYDDGFVVWSAWCGGGGLCDKQKSPSAHALCKGEPVDTGRPPPDFPEGGEDAPYNEDPSYGEPDDPYWPEDPYQSDDPYRPQGTARAIP